MAARKDLDYAALLSGPSRPDSQTADELGVSTEAVYAARRRLGLPSWAETQAGETWRDYRRLPRLLWPRAYVLAVLRGLGSASVADALDVLADEGDGRWTRRRIGQLLLDCRGEGLAEVEGLAPDPEDPLRSLQTWRLTPAGEAWLERARAEAGDVAGVWPWLVG